MVGSKPARHPTHVRTAPTAGFRGRSKVPIKIRTPPPQGSEPECEAAIAAAHQANGLRDAHNDQQSSKQNAEPPRLPPSASTNAHVVRGRSVRTVHTSMLRFRPIEVKPPPESADPDASQRRLTTAPSAPLAGAGSDGLRPPAKGAQTAMSTHRPWKVQARFVPSVWADRVASAATWAVTPSSLPAANHRCTGESTRSLRSEGHKGLSRSTP